MIQKALEHVLKEDIESLVNAKVSEKRTLDYKQEWPDNSAEKKRELLYDVSSFSNALGGDLVFGVEDERDAEGKATGLPASACGVAISNVSSEIARLENLVRDGIAPRIQGIEWKVVEGFPYSERFWKPSVDIWMLKIASQCRCRYLRQFPY